MLTRYHLPTRWLSHPLASAFGSRPLGWAVSAAAPTEGATTYRPAIDLVEHTDHYVLQADLPGVAQEDLVVEVEKGVLLLSGQRQLASKPHGEGTYYAERSAGRFERRFDLGDQVDANLIEAKLADGVLTVRLPKRAATTPQKIPVSAN